MTSSTLIRFIVAGTFFLLWSLWYTSSEGDSRVLAGWMLIWFFEG